MWFRFPKGYERISVEKQEFSVEVTDADGMGYFRAPDHFATKILSIGGFAATLPPDGSPADLPKADPLRDSAIVELTNSNQQFKVQIENLTSDLESAKATILALTNEKTSLEATITKLSLQIEDLEEQIDDKPVMKLVATGKK